MEFAPLTTKNLDGVDVASGTDYKKVPSTESAPASCSIIADVDGMTELLQIIIKAALITGSNCHLSLSFLSSFFSCDSVQEKCRL